MTSSPRRVERIQEREINETIERTSPTKVTTIREERFSPVLSKVRSDDEYLDYIRRVKNTQSRIEVTRDVSPSYQRIEKKTSPSGRYEYESKVVRTDTTTYDGIGSPKREVVTVTYQSPSTTRVERASPRREVTVDYNTPTKSTYKETIKERSSPITVTYRDKVVENSLSPSKEYSTLTVREESELVSTLKN